MIHALRNLLFATLPALLVCFGALEIGFRFLIPAAQVPVRILDPEEGIVRYDSGGPREGTFTRGRFAEVRARWRVNNFGWNSQIDYVPATGVRPKPLIAIIGDSFVNAFQVDPDENLAAVLRRMLADQFEVYGFGSTGAPLSHYLHMARYIRRHFDPQVFVFNVVHNDFHASLRSLEPAEQFWQLSAADGEIEEVPPSITSLPGRPWWWWSATARYLEITLQSHLLAGAPPTHARRVVANVPVDVLDENRKLIHKATDFVVGHIREENPDRAIVFMMDAPRLDLYAGTLGQSSVVWLNELLANACSNHGIPFVDLSTAFSEAFRRNGERFESRVDAHWNEVGHREAARALARKLIELGIARPPAGDL